MRSKKTIFSFFRLPYLFAFLSMALLVLLGMDSMNLSRLTMQHLKQSVKNQHGTRSILKVNLLVQRAYAQILFAVKYGNQAMFQDGADLMLAAEGFINGYKYFQVDSSEHMISEVAEISKELEEIAGEYPQRGEPFFSQRLIALDAKISHLYVDLSDVETGNWQVLSENNVNLENRIHRQRFFHFILLAFLAGTAVFLFRLLLLREKAEVDLQQAKSDLEVRVENRTAELQEEIEVRRKTEADLVNSREQLQSLMDISPVAISFADMQGNIQYSNQKFRELFGYTPEEIPTIEHWCRCAYADPLYRQQMAAEWQERVTQALEKNTEIPPLEVNITCKDNSIRRVLIMAAIRHNQIIAVFNDLSERIKAEDDRHALEERLQQALKMEAIGTLAGGIAHDFNNILSPILGYAELALLMVPPTDSLADSITEIQKAGERAKNLVKQILTFSRRGEQIRHPLLPHVVIKETIKLLRSSLPATIEIRENIPDNCGMILGDPTQVQQIVMNLCTNAYHAMREKGGILAITLRRNEITGDDSKVLSHLMQAGSYIEIEVSDTGCGVDAQVLEKIFEPYFTTKDKGEGTGLGLATVHGIVKGYCGHISVESEPGHGTAFHVYLPLEENAEPLESRLAVNGPLPGGSERLLLVDDEITITNLLSGMLRNLGYQVTSCNKSEEALLIFRQNPENFDLLITDMTMPHLTGLDLSLEIMTIKPGMPIILCTGFSDLVNREQAIARGIRDFLMKPLLLKDLAFAVRKALEENKVMS